MLGAAVATFTACIGLTGPASAQPFEHHPFHDEQSVVVSWCGSDIPFRNDYVITGNVTARITGRDGTIRYSQASHGEAVWTNLATERTITIVWNMNSQDVRVTDTGDGTLSILFQISGALKIYGPDNKLAVTDAGNFRLSVIVAHGGTVNDPSDDSLISETLLSARGSGEEGECDAFRRLTTEPH